jgi:hypothetical protein
MRKLLTGVAAAAAIFCFPLAHAPAAHANPDDDQCAQAAARDPFNPDATLKACKQGQRAYQQNVHKDWENCMREYQGITGIDGGAAGYCGKEPPS